MIPIEMRIICEFLISSRLTESIHWSLLNNLNLTSTLRKITIAIDISLTSNTHFFISYEYLLFFEARFLIPFLSNPFFRSLIATWLASYGTERSWWRKQ